MPSCSRLWCSTPGGEEHGCKTQHMPWADGTPCGEDRWCIRSECVTKHQTLSQIDGEWGEWQSWSSCSRSCARCSSSRSSISISFFVQDLVQEFGNWVGDWQQYCHYKIDQRNLSRIGVAKPVLDKIVFESIKNRAIAMELILTILLASSSFLGPVNIALGRISPKLLMAEKCREYV